MTTAIDYGIHADRPYWDGLAAGRLRMQYCDVCAEWRWPAVYDCPACGAASPAWRDLAPRGTIYSWVRTWQAIPGLESLGLPFVSVLVEIDGTDGQRLMGTLDGSDDGIAIGRAVTGTFVERTLNGVTAHTIVWRLA